MRRLDIMTQENMRRRLSRHVIVEIGKTLDETLENARQAFQKELLETYTEIERGTEKARKNGGNPIPFPWEK